MKVKKSGRTTGVTHGIIEAISVTVLNGTALFTNQIRIKGVGKPFGRKGDSGSLIVEDVESCPRPIGLLFAENLKGMVMANSISAVFDTLGVTTVGCQIAQALTKSAEEHDLSTAKLEPDNPVVAQVIEVQERYNDDLLSVPGVVGTGIGRSKKTGQVVIEVYIEKQDPKLKQLLPDVIDGIPIKVVVTGTFYSF
jgi:hypothetical protein